MFCHLKKNYIVILLWSTYGGTDAGFYVRDGHTFCRRGVSLSSVPARPSG